MVASVSTGEEDAPSTGGAVSRTGWSSAGYPDRCPGCGATGTMVETQIHGTFSREFWRFGTDVLANYCNVCSKSWNELRDIRARSSPQPLTE